jgi:hypothetical protein
MKQALLFLLYRKLRLGELICPETQLFALKMLEKIL